MKTYLVILLSIILGGCGYTTGLVLPASGEASIYVGNFVNKIDITKETSDEKIYYAYRPSLESDVTREVIDRFLFDGNFKVKDITSASYMLKGELINFERQPLVYDTNDNITEFRVRVVINMELHDLTQGTVVWRETNFAGESTYRTSGQLEALAVDEAVKDLARRIVERTVENW